jgi:hypothetical protein
VRLERTIFLDALFFLIARKGVRMNSQKVNLLSTVDVGDRLNVSPVTAIRLHDAGILPAVELVLRQRKRILRWRPEAVEAFIASREKSK